MLTRAKIGHLKLITFLSHVEPSNFEQALSQPEWNQAMQVEYNALMEN